MDSTPQSRRRKSRSDLVHLRSLPSIQPTSKTGQIIWAWAEIETGLAAGMTLKEVWEAATKDGFEMSYAQFRVYISRLRRRRKRPSPSPPQPQHAVTSADSGPPATAPSDPFRNLREEREKKERSGFDFDPFSTNKNLI